MLCGCRPRKKQKMGSRVRHATKNEWGVGQLLEDANSQSFDIFFKVQSIALNVSLPCLEAKLNEHKPHHYGVAA